MPSLVLTVIGDDRTGLVAAVADVVSSHGGNWERSQMAELAGKFAGIVVVTVPADRVEELVTSMRELDGLLEVSVYAGGSANAASDDESQSATLGILGNDRPGIVRELSSVLGGHGVTIDSMATQTREAPMAGGLLFEAQIEVRIPAGVDLASLRADLERLAAELLVDLDFAPQA